MMDNLAPHKTDLERARVAQDAAPVRIRAARPEDRPAMERICAQTWDWGDYVPEVWDGWLAGVARSPAIGSSGVGVLIVGEWEGQVVALSRIDFQTRDQVWLEAMRVDPDYRRRGIAGQFLDYSINFALERGARVVRLGTGGNNTPVHLIAVRAGMERVGIYVQWNAEPLPEGPPLVCLAPGQEARLLAFLDGSRVLAHTRGLYSVDWAWQELTAERAVQFLAASQVAAHYPQEIGLAALALIHADPDGEELWIGFADGQFQAVADLATRIRTSAARQGIGKVRVMLPDLEWLRDAFRTAGYGPGDWEGELWIFEGQLYQEGEGTHDR
jgi:GNAT superfamily N-acetyltransferase